MLKNQTGLDIDGLVPVAQGSATAYAVGKERIAAVRPMLAEHLIEDEGGSYDQELKSRFHLHGTDRRADTSIRISH